jgi:hypothetical protein
MTHATLLALALLPPIAPPLPPIATSWEKRCRWCPQRFWDECHALMEAGHMIRCYDVGDDEKAKLKEALRCQN